MSDSNNIAIIIVHHGTQLTPITSREYQIFFDGVSQHIDLQHFPLFQAFLNNRYEVTNFLLIRPLDKLLLQLTREGYSQLIIQPTLFVEGQQYKKLQKIINSQQHLFNKILIGTPLLYNINRCKEFAQNLYFEFKQYNTIIFIVHGGKAKGNLQWKIVTQNLQVLDSRLHLLELDSGQLLTNSSFNEYISNYIQSNHLSLPVTLIPLLLIKGHHFNEDISPCQFNDNIEVLDWSLSEFPWLQQVTAQAIFCNILNLNQTS